MDQRGRGNLKQSHKKTAFGLTALILFALTVSLLISEKKGCYNPVYFAYLQHKLEQEAHYGEPAAAYKLSFLYKNGQKKDKEKYELYLRMAAEKSHPGAEAELAWNYFFQYRSREVGYVCRENSEELVKWTSRAAEHGSKSAQHNLARFLLKGSCGFHQNAVEAYKWAKISKDNEHNLQTIAQTSGMTAAQIAEATLLADEWKGSSLDSLSPELIGMKAYDTNRHHCCTWGINCRLYAIP